MNQDSGTHDVVLDINWFVLDDRKLIKRIAFFDCENGMQLTFTVKFPSSFEEHSAVFEKQSRDHHGIAWNAPGFLGLKDITEFLLTIKYCVKARKVNFYARGADKCSVLEQQGIRVRNLVSCPPYLSLSDKPESVQNRVIAYGKWWRENRPQDGRAQHCLDLQPPVPRKP